MPTAPIEPLINEHTRAILITNPGNPTGVVLTPAERRLMADIAKEHDLFLIRDEVYREIVYGGEARPPCWSSRMRRRTWRWWTPSPSGSPPPAPGWVP